MEDLQLLSARVLMDDLASIGLVRGTTHELMEHNIFALFFPHGLGHFLGLDTHDPGGYPKGVQRIDRPGLRYLRARRTLETGMVVTIEPGCYFIPALLEPAFANPAVNKFLNVEKLKSMLDFGGIRIEDNLIITPDGNENMTTAIK
jgi:Xaa-Pro dipeptidase